MYVYTASFSHITDFYKRYLQFCWTSQDTGSRNIIWDQAWMLHENTTFEYWRLAMRKLVPQMAKVLVNSCCQFKKKRLLKNAILLSRTPVLHSTWFCKQGCLRFENNTLVCKCLIECCNELLSCGLCTYAYHLWTPP